MSEYRKQLFKYCGRTGYSMSAAGISAGYNKNYVSNIVSGKITPTIDALEKLAEVLQIPLAILLFGDQTDAVSQEIVTKLKDMDDKGQRAVSALVDSLSSSTD